MEDFMDDHEIHIQAFSACPLGNVQTHGSFTSGTECKVKGLFKN